ncbi:hypothetical protein NP493_1428g00007 [Ridgeia piscesae]|uniref:CLASP N-terminal domain-containing protein n=1 Tax=Ridgeia piscesae TaxID=27915 RepID=A0AAD9K4G2_RIDPI|nr:hypothetical protein NP493_1428g00007 [Ridgeia piscesae]
MFYTGRSWFLSVRLGEKFDNFALAIIPVLVGLLPNGTKVSSTSAGLCISIILENLKSNKLIPVITAYCSSNVKVIRRECASFLLNILRDWPKPVVARFSATCIPMTVKQCLYDTDQRTRNIAKDVFCEFAKSYPVLANGLMTELDTRRRQLLTNALRLNDQHIDLEQDALPQNTEKLDTTQKQQE